MNDSTKDNQNIAGLSSEIIDAIQPFTGDQGSTAIPSSMPVPVNQPLQQVRTTYVTAVRVQNPRQIPTVVKNVLFEAQLAGASFYYMWQVKNKKTGRKSTVKGPSIDLAMSCARNYGNCAVDAEVSETETHFLFKGLFIDLETGFTVPRLFRQRKFQDIGSGMDADRAEDIVFQIGQSKAQRNAIVRAMPNWLIDQAIETARKAEINKVKPDNLHLARGNVLAFFEKFGISQERIEAAIGVSVEDWTPENIADLRGSATAINDGRVDPHKAYPPIEKVQPAAPDPGATAGTSEPEKTQDSTPGTFKNRNAIDAFVKKWRRLKGGNLKTSGYHVWILENANEIKFFCQDNAVLLREMIKKYDETYGKFNMAWPLDKQFEPLPFPTPASDEQPQAQTQGADTGTEKTAADGMDQGEKVPETATDGPGEDEKPISFEQLTETAEYKQLTELWKLHPDFYKVATQGVDIATLEGVKIAIENINILITERIEAEANGEPGSNG